MGMKNGESSGQVYIKDKKVDVSTFVSLLVLIQNSIMLSLIDHAWCFGHLQSHPGAS